MAVRVGINGFGRIGRNVFRACLDETGLEFVAVNDITDAKTLAHLLEVRLGPRPSRADVSTTKDPLTVDGKQISVLAERDPAAAAVEEPRRRPRPRVQRPFTSKDKAVEAHPGRRQEGADLGARQGRRPHHLLRRQRQDVRPAKHDVLSNASCTTNCLAPVAKVLHETFRIRRGLMTTIHSYTNDQRILDLPHEDLRRARAAALSMIPTTTGAAKAVALVLPELEGKLDGMAVRVPTPNVSLVDLTAELEQEDDRKEINAAMKDAAEGAAEGHPPATATSRWSRCDFNGTSYSSIFDAAADQGDRRQLREGALLVRQRVGLLVPHARRRRSLDVGRGLRLRTARLGGAERYIDEPRRSPASACSSASTSTCRSRTASITDATRIEAALPTIQCARRARREGRSSPRTSAVRRASRSPSTASSRSPPSSQERLHMKVRARARLRRRRRSSRWSTQLDRREVLLLENLRFHRRGGEERPAFARQLAALADVYVNDAFGAAHRAHASTAGMAHVVPVHAAGLLMQKEIEALAQDHPRSRRGRSSPSSAAPRSPTRSR